MCWGRMTNPSGFAGKICKRTASHLVRIPLTTRQVLAARPRFPYRTFKEFLAACWLADQPDFCQRGVDLARKNPAHWREVLTFAARQAKVGRGVPAADALIHCQSMAEWSRDNQPGNEDWRATVLAGEHLLEIGLAAVGVREEHRAVRRQTHRCRLVSWTCPCSGTSESRRMCCGSHAQSMPG